MPYRWLEDVTRADAAFEATGADLVEVFGAAWEATVSVMLEEGPLPVGAAARAFALRSASWEDLLLALLEKIVFVKDAEGALLLPAEIALREEGGETVLAASAWAIPVESVLDRLRTDVKAVTLHRFAVWRDDTGWRATVVLDV
jgi:SHS2 domain-containing protein